jgi:hypothetical protein
MLRPQFTKTLAETLKKQSVNVHGEAGQGQDRLVKDISELMQQDGWLVLALDMKSWAQDYQGMLNSLSGQVRRQLPAVSQPLQEMSEVVVALDEHAAQTGVLLALENFDALLDNALHLDKNYINFFSHLNSLRNQANRALLVITGDTYNSYRLYAEDDIRNTSLLDLTLFPMRKLSYEEIQTEIQKRAPQLDESTSGQLKLAVYQNPRSFEFLEHCLIQISLGYDREKYFSKRLKLWKSSFERDHKKGLRRILEKFQNWLAIVGKETGNLSLKLKMVRISAFGLAALIVDALIKGKPLFDTLKGWIK